MLARALTCALALAVIGVASGCRAGDRYSRPPSPVRVQVVASTGPASPVRYGGRVAAATEVNLAFRVGGYVSAIAATTQPDGTRRLLQAGDPVRRSAVLASLRRSDYATRFDELRGMREGLTASVTKAKLDLDRAQNLLEERVIPQADFDAAKARYDSFVGEKAAAEARVGQAGIALADTELRSPLDGVVVRRTLEVGDLVAPGTSAFVVADTSKVKIVFGVPDSVQKQLRIDDPVTIRTEAVPGRKVRGSVTKIAESADDRSRVFDIEATIDNGEQALKIGFIATAELDSAAALVRRAAVPLSAVVDVPEKHDAYGVFVVTSRGGGTYASLRPVVLGDLVRNDVTVVAGVTQGELVIVVGASHVHDGERVAVIP